MRVYGHAYRDTMNLPMRVFWNLSGSVSRLLSGEGKSLLELTTLARNPEAAEAMFQSLNERSPEPVVISVGARIAASAVRDEVGFDALRNM